MLGTGWGCDTAIRLFSFAKKIRLGNSAIDYIPRQYLVKSKAAGGIEIGVYTGASEGIHPLFVIEARPEAFPLP